MILNSFQREVMDTMMLNSVLITCHPLSRASDVIAMTPHELKEQKSLRQG